MAANPQTPLTGLQDGSQAQINILDASWFRNHGRTRALPSPEQVRSLSTPHRLLQSVQFEEVDLIVESREQIPTSEATEEVFIYMQLILGHTLDQRWDSTTYNDKQAVCSDLQIFVSRFRKLGLNESQQVIGMCAGFEGCDFLPLLRPFTTRVIFRDLPSFLWRRHVADTQNIEDQWRDVVLNNGRIVFTHGDWAQKGWYPEYWEHCRDWSG
ncbi:hypothetical protein K505DRAFT_352358 [Melanomma pulvis-pyrius CBS 109.77]|uniref:Uncharacterized protein n=1 Tax=Melanomma pulvis-pyrius CBS 109.77 TaxID=1314802 RepID=A0A6A6X0T8_9PLEO|nr:hypothetical protein K505DRAFT_352358 [Melanomma pulvis-pyrius CBS 109.77]